MAHGAPALLTLKSLFSREEKFNAKAQGRGGAKMRRPAMLESLWRATSPKTQRFLLLYRCQKKAGRAGRAGRQETSTDYESIEDLFLLFLPSCLLLAALPLSESVPVPRGRRAQENISDEESLRAFAPLR